MKFKVWDKAVQVNVSLCVCAFAMTFATFAAQTVHANQTTNATFPSSCVSQSGVLGANNFITDFDNGTFGTANGSPDQTPATDPYPTQVTGGIYDEYPDVGHGDYSYIANIETQRNGGQHPANNTPNVTDPENGATGYFFASDPNADTPTLNFSITNIIPNENYELAFWAASSEFNAIPNTVAAVVDGIVSFSTGDLVSNAAALPWQRYAFVFNAGNRTVITLSMASTETGSRGRDFFLDNVTLQACALTSTGSLSGHTYSDFDSNDNFGGSDGTIANVSVQLWDTLGDADASNDIFVSTTASNAMGLYSFTNLAPSADYELRVDTADSDLPTGAVPGTAVILPATVTSGGTTSGRDFGFDPSSGLLVATKTVANYAGSATGYSLPGEDVIYTIEIVNKGAGAIDNNSIFLVDTLPPDVQFYNADMDGVGGVTSDPVAFTQSGAGLNFVYNRDIAFAGAGPKPANFAACNFSAPSGGIEIAIRYVCFNPKGAMASGSPDPTASFSFRARIN